MTGSIRRGASAVKVADRKRGATMGRRLDKRVGRKRRGGECGDESEQERSRTGGGAGRREQLAPCPPAGAGTRRQAGETELRRGRCGGSDVAGTPTQRPRKPSKRGRARCGTHRTGLILAVLRRRGGLWGGVRLSTLEAKEEGASHYRVARTSAWLDFWLYFEK